jgi:hypothetical protein
MFWFLGKFAYIQNMLVTCIMLSVHAYQRGSHGTDFVKFDIGDSLKPAKKIQIYLQLDSNIGTYLKT